MKTLEEMKENAQKMLGLKSLEEWAAAKEVFLAEVGLKREALSSYGVDDMVRVARIQGEITGIMRMINLVDGLAKSVDTKE